MNYLRKILAIVWKDIVAELRTKEMFSAMFVFSVLVIVVFNFAFDLRVSGDRVRQVAPGALWVAFAFSGVLGLNRAFVVEREPPRPYLLGLYEGRPLTSRSVSDGFVLPDRITIYQGPHERLARDRLHLEELLRDTVWHEVAHYFGMDERRVRRAEKRRAGRHRLL